MKSQSVDPRRVVFEVTETAAIADVASAQRFINDLKAMGCRFALDDFGVGFSSLDHLKQLPVDYLKLDGSFVRGLTDSPVNQKLVRAIVGIARALDIETIAEFVGNAGETALLRDLGVDLAQGYYIGRPRSTARMLSAGSSAQARAA